MFLSVYTSFKCNFAGKARKIAFETSINIRDEPSYVFMGFENSGRLIMYSTATHSATLLADGRVQLPTLLARR
ncbi:MAG: hypothetical protein NVSMB44_20460 [Ktedonobacteraceae bacterium]